MVVDASAHNLINSLHVMSIARWTFCFIIFIAEEYENMREFSDFCSETVILKS